MLKSTSVVLFIILCLTAHVAARSAFNPAGSEDKPRKKKTASSYSWVIAVAIVAFILIVGGTATLISKCIT